MLLGDVSVTVTEVPGNKLDCLEEDKLRLMTVIKSTY